MTAAVVDVPPETKHGEFERTPIRLRNSFLAISASTFLLGAGSVYIYPVPGVNRLEQATYIVSYLAASVLFLILAVQLILIRARARWQVAAAQPAPATRAEPANVVTLAEALAVEDQERREQQDRVHKEHMVKMNREFARDRAARHFLRTMVNARKHEERRSRCAAFEAELREQIRQDREDDARIAAAREIAAQAHMLYRIYNSKKDLLYIGITNNLDRRFSKHSRTQSWWHEVDERLTTVEHHASRLELEAFEHLAIVQEKPKYNIIHGRYVR